VEATVNHTLTINFGPFCFPNYANDGYIQETTFPITKYITIATKEEIKDIQRQTELGSFPNECGGVDRSEGQTNLLLSSGPLHLPVGPVTVNTTQASGDSGTASSDVAAASTQQAAVIFSHCEELKLVPPDTRP